VVVGQDITFCGVDDDAGERVMTEMLTTAGVTALTTGASVGSPLLSVCNWAAAAIEAAPSRTIAAIRRVLRNKLNITTSFLAGLGKTPIMQDWGG
jgi:hypothetical protein